MPFVGFERKNMATRLYRLRKRISSTIRFLLPFFLSSTCWAGLQLNVDIQGIKGKHLDNVKLFLSIEQQKKHPALNERRVQRLHARASQEISTALKPFGYYSSQVKAELSHNPNNDSWTATYSVTLGSPVRIRKVDAKLFGEGILNPGFLNAIKNVPLKENDILNHAQYEQLKSDLLTFARSNGYFEVNFLKKELRVFPEQLAADITVYLDTGPRYHFGSVSFRQQFYNTSYLRRFLPFSQADPYSLDKIVELQDRLHDSDNFRSIEINQQKPLIDSKEIPIEVVLNPRKKHFYQLGLGYGTDTGARGTARWHNRRLNLRGHRMSLELRAAEVKQEASIRVSMPLKRPNTDKLEFAASHSEEHILDTESQTRTLGISRTIARGNRWLQTDFIEYLSGPFEIANIPNSSIMLIFGTRFSRTQADDPIFPKKGFRLVWDTKAAIEGLLDSSTQYFQTKLLTKFVYPVGPGKLLARAELGYTDVKNFSSLRPELRFFAGGDTSVRGYKYQSLSPTDALGNTLGGERLIVGSIEYQYWFKRFKNWGIGSFFDVGNAIDQWNDELASGVGVGVSWRSPVGPISLNFAKALTNFGQDTIIHISIGPGL